MNQTEEIKALKLRLTLLEFQVGKIQQLFEIQVQAMAEQNQYVSPQCTQCYMSISQKEPGSCDQESCPCGLN